MRIRIIRNNSKGLLQSNNLLMKVAEVVRCGALKAEVVSRFRKLQFGLDN
jgi:hypothetical protein